MTDLTSISKNVIKPPRICVYGPPGVGKTTFAAKFPKPVFILTEEGLGDLEAEHLPFCTTYEEVLGCLAALGREDHEYKTVVIDSLDALEKLIWEHTCKRMNYSSIEAPGWGKGYAEAQHDWAELIAYINALRDEKGLTVVAIAHSAYVHIADPERPAYDTNTLNLHKYANPLIIAEFDIIGFATQKVFTKVDEAKKDDKRVRAVAGTERELRLSISPAFTAKNRYHMKESIPLDYEEFAKQLPKKKEG